MLHLIIWCFLDTEPGLAFHFAIPSQQVSMSLRASKFRLDALPLTTSTILFSQISQYDAADDDPDEFNIRPFYPHPRVVDASLLGDLTGGRPGAIIETEEQLELKEQILQEVATGERHYDEASSGIRLEDYGESLEDEEADFDTDDPDAIDAATLGTWTIQDIRSKYEYEWDPKDPNQVDPNYAALHQDGSRYLTETEKDEDGVEIGYDPVFGPSNPMDQRTILGVKDSFMIDARTRDETMLAPLFPEPNDPEIDFNEDVVQFRKSLDIIETYTDEFLGDAYEIPRHVAKWHGYPEQTFLEPKPYTNNRFTDPEKRTNFDAMTPWEARQKAVELARAKNAEWLPDGTSQEWHRRQREPYEKYDTLVGTLRRGDCDADMVQRVQPALQVFGSCVELLSIDIQDNEESDVGKKNVIFRFHYHGLMKNRYGMKAWMRTMMEECLDGSPFSVTNVIFETGFRKRDPAYDGGDAYYGITTAARMQ